MTPPGRNPLDNCYLPEFMDLHRSLPSPTEILVSNDYIGIESIHDGINLSKQMLWMTRFRRLARLARQLLLGYVLADQPDFYLAG
jgi:hypothetical protein